MRAVLLNSENISRHYSTTLRKIEDDAEKERERIANKHKLPQFTLVEPNLTRLAEERKLKKE
jgi:hypothetical protein